jgi:hypothetical protein
MQEPFPKEVKGRGRSIPSRHGKLMTHSTNYARKKSKQLRSEVAEETKDIAKGGIELGHTNQTLSAYPRNSIKDTSKTKSTKN